VGQISDSKTERYDFTLPLPKDEAQAASASAKSAAQATTSDEHTIIVYVYDRFDNMGVSKVVVNVPASR
jgi:peptidyl-tRNA hydrolase